MRLMIVALALLAASLAYAQQAQPFAPLTIDKTDFDQLRSWLLEQPTKFGGPVVQWLDTQEAKALAAAKAKADKAAEKVPAAKK